MPKRPLDKPGVRPPIVTRRAPPRLPAQALRTAHTAGRIGTAGG